MHLKNIIATTLKTTTLFTYAPEHDYWKHRHTSWQSLKRRGKKERERESMKTLFKGWKLLFETLISFFHVFNE